MYCNISVLSLMFVTWTKEWLPIQASTHIINSHLCVLAQYVVLSWAVMEYHISSWAGICHEVIPGSCLILVLLGRCNIGSVSWSGNLVLPMIILVYGLLQDTGSCYLLKKLLVNDFCCFSHKYSLHGCWIAQAKTICPTRYSYHCGDNFLLVIITFLFDIYFQECSV